TLFFFQAGDGIRGGHVTGVQPCALPISAWCLLRAPLASPRARPSGARNRHHAAASTTTQRHGPGGATIKRKRSAAASAVPARPAVPCSAASFASPWDGGIGCTLNRVRPSGVV